MPEEKIVNKIFAFGAGKGGVGKSIVSAGVSLASSRLTDRKVIVISADPSSKSLDCLLEGGYKPGKGWVDFISDAETTIYDAIAKSKLSENLYVIYSAQENVFSSESKNADLAANRLAGLKQMWNSDPEIALVVIDTAATTTKDHLIYALAGSMYIVTTSDELDLAAAKNFREILNAHAFKLLKTEFECIKGVIANMISSQKDVEIIKNAFDLPVVAPVPFSRAVGEANKKHLPVTAYKPEDPASKAMYEIARKMLGMVNVEIKEPAKRIGLMDVIKAILQGRRSAT